MLSVAHPRNNVPDSIRAKVGRKLLLQPGGHPLAALKRKIQAHFASGAVSEGARFACFDDLHPVVSVAQNFDDLLTPADHPSRSPTDTFYVDDSRLLRCHMTAHQTTLLREGHSAFLMAGDVYRRDAVDATHYPVFHQVDGVRTWTHEQLPPAVAAALKAGDRAPAVAHVVADLKACLSGLARTLFGPDVVMRWVDATFPFTDPSLELEVQWEGQWLEVLGCGMIRQPILEACGQGERVGWAFGMGVERLAMVLHGIPDIRLFWTDDARFHAQFAGAGADKLSAPPVQFVPYSKQPACYKDVAFWLPTPAAATAAADAAAAAAGGAAAAPAPFLFHENDVFAAVREAAGDLVESVVQIDDFKHPKTGRRSVCFRILYRSMDRSLTNEEVNVLQDAVRGKITQAFPGCTLR